MLLLFPQAASHFRQSISNGISERSVVRNQQYPSRRNTWIAAIFIILVAPLALIAIPVVLAATLLKRKKLEVTVLAVDHEFAPVIELLELLRANVANKRSWCLILILSRYRHETLDSLYSLALHCRIIRSFSFYRVLQQVLLLQPKFLVSRRRLRGNRTFALPHSPLQLTDSLIKQRNHCLTRIGLREKSYVALAVYSLQYDEERNPQEAEKHAMLESDGSDLVAGIDYLQQCNVGVVLLGSEDTKKSSVPRPIPRLSQFGHLGGADEVALASGCDYFWNDSDVGAWWLSLPFRRPILTTNKPRIRLKTDFSGYEHLVVPIRYSRPDGSILTFRELLSMESAPFKAASRGELLQIRNSPDEVIEAHIEMRARSSGSWKDDSRTKELQMRSQKVFSEFPGNFPMNISSHFLHKHSYLLD